jgi:diguanylate cyclase (GGDEF)-like protein
MKNRALSLFTSWRYFALGPENYRECTEKLRADNMNSLRRMNMVCAVLALLYTPFPIFVEGNLFKGVIFVIAAAMAMFVTIMARRKLIAYKEGKPVSPVLIYTLMTMGYINVMCFGVYLGVWSNPEFLAVAFMIFLVCALFLYCIPPVLNLCLTLCAITFFVVATILAKDSQLWRFDLANVSIAGCLSLIFSWYISRFRMLAVHNEIELEKERNKYYDESLVDELTQLRNKRDFTITFERYLTSYRESDRYLCLALIDIDFFKNYNDHYGHAMGDECLRSVGKALNDLKSDKSVYSARVGGEEFAILWFEEDKGEVDSVTSQVHENIMEADIPHANSSISDRLTVSIGVYIAVCGEFDDTRVIYDLADTALYEAKDKGRNRTVVSQA